MKKVVLVAMGISLMMGGRSIAQEVRGWSIAEEAATMVYNYREIRIHITSDEQPLKCQYPIGFIHAKRIAPHKTDYLRSLADVREDILMKHPRTKTRVYHNQLSAVKADVYPATFLSSKNLQPVKKTGDLKVLNCSIDDGSLNIGLTDNAYIELDLGSSKGVTDGTDELMAYMDNDTDISADISVGLMLGIP